MDRAINLTMPQTTSISVQVHSRNHRDSSPTSGSINQETYNRQDQVRNALKTLGVGLAITFCTVFIPIMHFILTPTFFIGSFVFAMGKLSEKAQNLGGQGECPSCHQSFVIEKSKWKDRFTDTCNHCHDDLEIIPQI